MGTVIKSSTGKKYELEPRDSEFSNLSKAVERIEVF